MTKIAVIHDYLCGVGGSERVFKYITEEFTEADVYTLAFNPSCTLPYFSKITIRTTWLNKFVQTMSAFRWSFPVATYVMESLDLEEYDLVLTSSATVAKYVRTKKPIHVCYCYIPTRALWQNEKYFNKSLVGFLIRPLLTYLRKRDLKAACGVDRFISISDDSSRHIKAVYDRESEVLFSPIECEKFIFKTEKQESYLLVSRLEIWKEVEYAILAFNTLKLSLKIIGTGSHEAHLKSIAGPTIQFLGELNDYDLVSEYANARAVISTPELEYGLVPLEALCSGTPVIALGRGGILETMIPWSLEIASTGKYTSVFYSDPTAAALISAVQQFNGLTFDANFLFDHAKKFDVPIFKKRLREILNEELNI